MKKHIFIAFLSIALFQGFLFAEVDSVPDSNTSQSSISDTYQEEDVLISFIKYFFRNLNIKVFL